MSETGNVSIGRRAIAVGELNKNEAASPIIKKIAMDFLQSNPEQKMPLRVIKDVVEQLAGESYSPGAFSGAMRDLIEESKGKIVNIERGYYIYMANAKTYEINKAIDDLINHLNEIAVVNVLTADDEDIQAIRKIPNIQSKLNELKIN